MLKMLFIGDDWAEDHHDVELQDEEGRVLVVTVAAAVVQSVLVRRWWRGVATVAAPVIGGLIILWALAHRDGYLGVDGPRLPILVVFVLVLVGVGVGVREIGSRVGIASRAGLGEQ
ncbi:hypothetical protein [Tsukamurella spumae]|uniref:hypothetical protein n=1 Tax=Tsukamurella spumae TaxID=44753 RepID=UPI001B34CB69|nr:hypothetical protein [Tsukamurella spumae]